VTTVREALVSDPPVLAGSASGREVAEALARPNVTTVLVVDGERFVGAVHADAVVAAVARGDDVARLTAADLADGGVATIGPDEALDDALHRMVENDLERIAVVEDGRLLGILPCEPLVRRLAEEEPPPDETEGEGS